MAKTTYWLADPEGVRAPIEGVDARNYLTQVHGWTEATEPKPHDFVWVRNESPELGAVRMTWEAAQLDAWAGRGWTPGYPLAVDEPPAPEPPKSSPKPAASGDKKE